MSESEDEYPTDEELERIVNWPYTDVDAGLEYCVSLWHWPKSIQREDGALYLATGGWSGNEAIIGAMRKNIGLWSRWICSSRGGAHEFELEDCRKTRDSRFRLAHKLHEVSTSLEQVKQSRDEWKRAWVALDQDRDQS